MHVNTFAYGFCVGCDEACPVNVLVVESDTRMSLLVPISFILFLFSFFLDEATSRAKRFGLRRFLP